MSRIALRLLTSLWALWFGAALVEPAALQTCPMHGAHAGHGHVMSGAVRHAVSGHGAAKDAGSDHPAGDRHPAGGCTCIGACCGAPTLAVPTASIAELPATVVVAESAVPISAARVPSAAEARYAHPFANGPPLLAEPA